MTSQIAPLALTMGEPAGIGGELTLMAWARRKAEGLPAFYAIDDPARLRALAARIGVEAPIAEIGAPEEARAVFATALPVLACPLSAEQTPGVPVAGNAASAISSIERAVADALSGAAAGVVTNPISKQALREGAGFAFPGHTEFLGALCGARRSVMMLAAPGLRVVPVTVHVALRDVFDLLTTETIVSTARIVARALRDDFGLAAPRLAVAGLNPHAGEGGSMGSEDDAIIRPAVETLSAEGIRTVGPLPADTMFHEDARSGYDAALCMYHDQALIPLKTLDFHRGVNVTLGLPIVRTSPDHGTAFALAGQGTANPSSLIEALRVAARIAGNRQPR